MPVKGELSTAGRSSRRPSALFLQVDPLVSFVVFRIDMLGEPKAFRRLTIFGENDRAILSLARSVT